MAADSWRSNDTLAAVESQWHPLIAKEGGLVSKSLTLFVCESIHSSMRICLAEQSIGK